MNWTTTILQTGFSARQSRRRAWILVFPVLSILAAAPDPARAAGPWYVDASLSDANTCLSPAAACRTIGAAITKASSGDTINVAAGTYNEQVVISKPLTVTGADGAILDGTGLVPTWTTGVKIRSGNVTFDNIDVTNFTQDGITAYKNVNMPNLHITNCKVSNIQPGYWGFGIYIGYESEGFGYVPPDLTAHLDFSGLLIEGNEITNTHSSALVLQSITGTPGTLVVRNNSIHDNTTNDAIWVDCARELTIQDNDLVGNLWGIDFSALAEDPSMSSPTVDGAYSPKNVTVIGNRITGTAQQGISVFNAWPSTLVFDGNLIAGNGTGVENFLDVSVAAAGNSWGSETGAMVASNAGGLGDSVVGPVDYSPWRKSDVDADPLSPGFQAVVPTTFVVNANSAPGYTGGGVQDGIDHASAGDTVEVLAGIYHETNITVNRSLTLTGDPGATCPGTGPAAPEIVGTFTGSERGFIIASGVDNVTIEGFVVRDMGVVPQTEAGGACGVWAYDTTANPTEHVTIRNNAFRHVGWTHVFFYNEAQSAYNDINISCNAIDIGVPNYDGYGANQYGIECTNCVNSSISDNQISGGDVGIIMSAQTNPGRSMTAGHGTISGNTIENAAFTGIYSVPWSLGGAEPTLQNVSIVDNQVSGNAAGIMVYNSVASVVRDYTITGNTIVVTNPAADGRAVLLSNVSGNSTFEDNSVVLAGTAPPSYFRGVDVSGAASGNWTIARNVLVAGTAAGASGSGIRLSSTLPLTSAVGIDCNRIESWATGVLSLAPNAPVLATNSIKGNAVALSQGGAGTIGAENNWWGCAAGPGGAGCDTIVGSVDSTPWAVAVPSCVTCSADANCDDGLFCSGVETCTAGACSAPSGDPCTGGAGCGNVCNEAADNCLVAAGTVCRSAAGVCDVPETCDGNSETCPSDVLATAATTCRASSGSCDVAEACTGIAVDCPADAFASAATSCTGTSQGGVCDGSDHCAGTSAGCVDVFQDSATVCRAAAGVCDLAETCTGTSGACPSDALATTATTCRASSGSCDVAETCTGSAMNCPADAFASAVTSCTGTSQGGVCDGSDHCSGTADTCVEVFQAASVVCRASAGQCDVAETCTGASGACPADALAVNGTSCDDNLFCNGTDSCSAGACATHGASPCPGADGDANCSESCNEAVNDCSTPDPDGSSCDDGNACTIVNVCASGTCGVGSPLDCDDGSLCTTDSCDAVDGCINTGQPQDPAGCFDAGRSRLVIRNAGTTVRNSVTWSWDKGDYTAADLGTPAVDTDYTLCIFDQAAGIPTLVASYTVPGGAGGWKASSSAVKYADSLGSGDGVTDLKMRGLGAAGRSSGLLKAGGANLVVPAPYSGSVYFQQDTLVVAQLLNSAGACWNTEFTAAVTGKNTAELFRAESR